MPNMFSPSTGGGRSTPTAPSISQPGASAKANLSAGRVQLSVADPSGSIQKSIGDLNAGFIGVGKGLVSVAENFPIIGAIAKPIIGFTGSIVDATIGQGVSALEKIRIGDSNLAQATVGALETAGTPLKWGLDAISAPAQFVEQKAAEARIMNTQTGRQDLVSLFFGSAPKDVMAMVSGGASIEQAAEHLAKSNAGYSENGLANLGWSLLLDPINFIAPGIGKVASVGKEASMFMRIADKAALEGAAGAAAAAEASAFLGKWGWAGHIYNSTIAPLSKFTQKFASTPAKEAAAAIGRVHDLKTVDGLLDDIAVAAGMEVADRGLANYAVTAMNAIKSGAVRAVTAIRRSGSEDLSNTIVHHFWDGLDKGKTVPELLASKVYDGGDVTSLLKKIGLDDADITKLTNTIQEKMGIKRLDELVKDKDVQDIIGSLTSRHANWTVANKGESLKMVADFRAKADARLASEEMTRVLFEAKNDVVALAADPVLGVQELSKYLVNGFGLNPEQALAIAQRQFAKYAGDTRKLTDILSVARGANFGQAARKLAGVRSLFKKGDDFAKITITSQRSLTREQAEVLIKRVDDLKAQLNKAVNEGDTVLQTSLKNELKAEADRLVQGYDEFAAQFGTSKIAVPGETLNGLYTYDQIFDFLNKAKNITVRELSRSQRERIALEKVSDDAVRQIDVLEKELNSMGYRLGIAPEDNISRVTTLATDHFGKEKLIEMTMPFADTIDHLAIDALDNAGVALRPSRLGRIFDKVSRPFGSEVTKNVVAERFVTNMVGKYGISVNRARSILVKVNSLAAEKGVQTKALFSDANQLEEIFRFEMKDSYGKILDKGSTPFKEILDAASGDLSSAGLTSGFTGRVKAIFPAITILTDKIYPEVRFGVLNPFFNLVLERIETATQKITYGIRKEAANEFSQEITGTTLRRAYLDPRNVNREIADGQLYLAAKANRNTAAAVETATTFKKRVQNRIKPWFSIENVRKEKEIARDIMSDKFAANEFLDLLDKAAPGKLEELAIHFGVNNPNDVAQLLLEEYMIQSDPIRFAQHVADNGLTVRRLVSKELVEKMGEKAAQELADAVVGAYEVALLKGSRAADKAQYFASQRTWLERSLNHPYLGIYPYSYTTQKVIPMMMRLMFLTPGPGRIVMPGFGFAKYQQFLEYANNRMNSDPTLLDKLVQNDALLYVVSTLLPATPDNIGFSGPAWLRRGFIQPALRGKELNIGNLAPALTEAGAQLTRGTVLGQGRTMLEGVQAIQDTTQVNQGIGGFIQENIPSSQDIQDIVLGIRGN
jgi:hypothetical protein